MMQSKYLISYIHLRGMKRIVMVDFGGQKEKGFQKLNIKLKKKSKIILTLDIKMLLPMNWEL